MSQDVKFRSGSTLESGRLGDKYSGVTSVVWWKRSFNGQYHLGSRGPSHLKYEESMNPLSETWTIQ